MRKVYRSNLFFFIILVGSIFGNIVLGRLFVRFNITDSRIMLLTSHVTLFLIPSILYVIFTKQSFKDVFKFNKLPFKDLLLVKLLGFICVPLMSLFGVISSLFFENTLSTFMNDISSTPYIILMLLIAVMPAITEEVTLRGVVLHGYDDKSKFKAALMCGIMFGIFHLNAHQFLYTMVMGFILAYAVRVTGSIYTSMIMHFILNGTSLTLQKIISITGGSNALEEAVEASSRITASSGELIVLLVGAVFWIIVMGTLAWTILWKLEKRYNIRNGITLKEIQEFKYKESDERIINLPFIMSVIVYFVFMILFKL